MSKPTVLPRWATDVNTTTDPGEAKKNTGYFAGEKPAPKVLNWLLNLNYLWNSYVANLENEPDFLGKLYRWTAKHDFQNGLMASGAGVYNSGEVYYTDAAGALTARTRTVRRPWLEASQGLPDKVAGPTPSSGQAGATDVGGSMLLIKNGTFDPPNANSSFPVVIPQGATLTGWRVLCVTNAQNFSFEFELKEVEHDFATPGLGTPARVGALQSQSGAASTAYAKGQAGISKLMTSERQLWIEARVTSDPAPPTTYELLLAGVELTYTEYLATGHR
jgi:hypothetical protein